MTGARANGVDPGWLRLRGTADVRARAAYTGDLVDGLAHHLRQVLLDDGPARLVDVGAGTGAGASWLREQLPVEQDWRLVDHDPRILAAAPDSVRRWGRGVVAYVEDLPQVLEAEPAHVVTCQALLDVLTREDVDALVASAVRSGAALLLSLSVTGQADLFASHPDDDVIAEAFDAHQRRDGRLGPDGGHYAAAVLRRHGYAVSTAASPWRLGVADSALLSAWLEGRATAAEEQEPALSERARRWLSTRQESATRGELVAVVGHVDVLALPPLPTR